MQFQGARNAFSTSYRALAFQVRCRRSSKSVGDREKAFSLAKASAQLAAKLSVRHRSRRTIPRKWFQRYSSARILIERSLRSDQRGCCGGGLSLLLVSLENSESLAPISREFRRISAAASLVSENYVPRERIRS